MVASLLAFTFSPATLALSEEEMVIASPSGSVRRRRLHVLRIAAARVAASFVKVGVVPRAARTAGTPPVLRPESRLVGAVRPGGTFGRGLLPRA